LYQHALPIIEKSLIDILPSTSGLESLNYYMFCGLIFIGLKRFKDAIRAFKKLMIVPAKGINEIHINAFKKLVLLGIIEGYEFELSSSTQDCLRNNLKLGDGQLQLENMRSNPLNFTPYE